MRNNLFLCITIFLLACSSENKDANPEITVQFIVTATAMSEANENKQITLNLSNTVGSNEEIVVSVNSNDATINSDYTLDPISLDQKILLPVDSGSEEVSFQISTIDNETIEEDKYLEFEISSVSDGLIIGNRDKLTLRIENDDREETTGEPDDLSAFQDLELPAGIQYLNQFEWQSAEGKLTLLESLNFSDQSDQDNDQEGFYWTLPSKIKEVVIAANVTITGGFRTQAEVIIRGEDRETSRIFGTDSKNWALGPNGETDSSCGNRAGDDRAHDCEKWQYGAVSPTVFGSTYPIHVQSLTIENARTYAITAFNNPVMVDNVHIINTRPAKTDGNDYRSNSDGIGGGEGSVVTNTLIDTWDDGIKLYKDFTVKNVTIIHNANGAPLQLGWGAKDPTIHTIENVKIIPADSGPAKHNLAMISASLTSGSVDATLNIKGAGLFADYSGRTGLQIRTGDPLPYVWLKSADAKVKLVLDTDANAELKAPATVMGEGSATLQDFCEGNNNWAFEMKCGTEVATGAGF
ncbi:DUF916 domain-containing protein [Reichenbachiella ulvae]|uniref:DUF916 domain-containing protein n=1 Tax=Reichenbachiella ulvae TaxID=2980104 RepID=A0ABT3D023_9BACT|nr:DUF916 domain-containing protein [Reichenbachiella ulvae]MCV9389298.1 DUF916 domain-containing protein [Reichenbachiella ulvae]